MSNEKIKPKLNGTAETMLQCFYARAMHSRNPKNKFRDTKAEELIDRIDYDFSNAKKDTAMSGGIVVRSVVFDELVSDFIRKNPDCTVDNIARGMETLNPIYKLVMWMPIVHKFAEKILVFEKA